MHTWKCTNMNVLFQYTNGSHRRITSEWMRSIHIIGPLFGSVQFNFDFVLILWFFLGNFFECMFRINFAQKIMIYSTITVANTLCVQNVIHQLERIFSNLQFWNRFATIRKLTRQQIYVVCSLHIGYWIRNAYMHNVPDSSLCSFGSFNVDANLIHESRNSRACHLLTNNILIWSIWFERCMRISINFILFSRN